MLWFLCISLVRGVYYKVNLRRDGIDWRRREWYSFLSMDASVLIGVVSMQRR